VQRRTASDGTLRKRCRGEPGRLTAASGRTRGYSAQESTAAVSSRHSQRQQTEHAHGERATCSAVTSTGASHRLRVDECFPVSADLALNLFGRIEYGVFAVWNAVAIAVDGAFFLVAETIVIRIEVPEVRDPISVGINIPLELIGQTVIIRVEIAEVFAAVAVAVLFTLNLIADGVVVTVQVTEVLVTVPIAIYRSLDEITDAIIVRVKVNTVIQAVTVGVQIALVTVRNLVIIGVEVAKVLTTIAIGVYRTQRVRACLCAIAESVVVRIGVLAVGVTVAIAVTEALHVVRDRVLVRVTVVTGQCQAGRSAVERRRLVRLLAAEIQDAIFDEELTLTAIATGKKVNLAAAEQTGKETGKKEKNVAAHGVQLPSPPPHASNSPL